MFEVKILENSKYLWVDLNGKLMTEENEGEMFKLICDNISESRSIVILNLLNLEYINSSGVNNILKILTKSRNLGGDSILCNLNSVIEKLLITTKLNTIFRVQNQIENLEDFMNKN
jgi:anti-sigma B factor antagonist